MGVVGTSLLFAAGHRRTREFGFSLPNAKQRLNVRPDCFPDSLGELRYFVDDFHYPGYATKVIRRHWRFSWRIIQAGMSLERPAQSAV